MNASPMKMMVQENILTALIHLVTTFEFNRLVNTPGLNFRVNKKKYSYSFGSSVAFSHFVQNNITEKRIIIITIPISFPVHLSIIN